MSEANFDLSTKRVHMKKDDEKGGFWLVVAIFLGHVISISIFGGWSLEISAFTFGLLFWIELVALLIGVGLFVVFAIFFRASGHGLRWNISLSLGYIFTVMIYRAWDIPIASFLLSELFWFLVVVVLMNLAVIIVVFIVVMLIAAALNK